MKCKDIFSVSDRKVGSATQKLEEIQLQSSYILHTPPIYFRFPSHYDQILLEPLLQSYMMTITE